MTEQQNLIPKRRFKEFQNTDTWEQRELSQLIDLRSGRDYKHLTIGNIPVYGTGGYMLSVNDALSYDDAIGIGRKGTIDKPFLLMAPFWTVDTLFYAIPKENNNLNFLYNIFRKINWRQKDESTGVPSLSKVAINSAQVFVPKYTEQKAIGDFFKTIDDLITLHQRKLEKTKALKSAYLSEMFPAEDEQAPKSRFPGFSGTWEQCKLSELANYRRGSFPQPYGNKEWYDEKNGMPFVQVVDVGKNLKLVDNTKQKISELAQPHSVFVEKGKVLITLQGSIGRVAITQYPCYVDRTLLIFESYKRPINEYYFAYIIQQLFEKEKLKAPGGTIKTITKEALSEFLIFIPSVEEQSKIAEFLKQLDETTVLHQRKLEKLQNLKKAYLHEMFV